MYIAVGINTRIWRFDNFKRGCSDFTFKILVFTFAGKTAPANGLFFLGPKYKDELNIDTFEINILDRLKK